MSNYLGKKQPHQNDAVFIHVPHRNFLVFSVAKSAYRH